MNSDSVELQQTQTINIDIKKSHPLTNQISEIKTIVLNDSNAEVSPGIIFNGEILNDTLYAIDAYKSPEIYAYSITDGRQLYGYSKVGNGPEDILTLSDLNVNPNSISAYDRINNRILKIDKHGNFISVENAPSDATEAIVDNNGNIWIEYSNNDDNCVKLSYISSESKIEQTIRPTPNHLKGIMVVPKRSFFKMSDGSISYYPWLENTIYTLQNGKISKKYFLNLNGLMPDEKELRAWAINGDWADHLRKMPLKQLTYCEDTDRVVIFLKVNDTGYIHLYNKTSKIGKTYEDIDNRYIYPIAVTGEKLYMLTDEDSTIDVLTITD